VLLVTAYVLWFVRVFCAVDMCHTAQLVLMAAGATNNESSQNLAIIQEASAVQLRPGYCWAGLNKCSLLLDCRTTFDEIII
jgi:hypothetical protein